MGVFTPEFDGQVKVERLPDDFAARIRQRVEDGLFVPGRRDRANYRVTRIDRDTVSGFAPTGTQTWLTLDETTVTTEE